MRSAIPLVSVQPCPGSSTSEPGLFIAEPTSVDQAPQVCLTNPATHLRGNACSVAC